MSEAWNGRTSAVQIARKHIFVVHSSADLLDLIRQFLQAERYNVTTTNLVPLTFDIIQVAQPSLVIVDLIVGEHHGWDLLAHLRESASTQAIPILMLSTTPQLLDRARELAPDALGDDYLAMPFDADVFMGIVARMIGDA